MRQKEYIALNSQTIQTNRLSDFAQLIKFPLTSVVVFTSVAAYIIAANVSVNWYALLLLITGGYLVTGASNIFNEVLEKDYDALMQRTQNRPIAAGRMTMSSGVLLGGLMSMIGITILSLFNPLTGLLGMLSLIVYSFLYTPLKRYSTVAVFVGAIAGAMPMLIGCVAFEGHISVLAILLFGLQFFWQFAHFWAIGYLSFDEYEKAGFNFIPKKEDGTVHTRITMQALMSCLVLLPICLYTANLLQLGTISLVIVGVLCLGFGYEGFRFVKKPSRATALRLMFVSIAFLPLVLIAIIVSQIF